MLASAVYLQVSTISQALIFVTRSRSWSFVERPGVLLVVAFFVAQLVRELVLPISVTLIRVLSEVYCFIFLFFNTNRLLL